MTNHEMLENIEYLRERANVTYEEAEALLREFDGNVMRVLVALEKQGRVYHQAQDAGEPSGSAKQAESPVDEGIQKTKSFLANAMRTHLVVEQKKPGKQIKVADVPVPLVAIGAIAAPWLAVAAVGLGYATGHHAKIVKHAPGGKPNDSADES